MGVYNIKKCNNCEEEYLGHIATKLCDNCKTEEFEKAILELVCPQCGVTFFTIKTNKRFCNKFCRKEFHREAYYG
jgi:hypothetical protein